MRNRHSIPLLSLTFALAATAPYAAAPVYKWTDENGVVNYSNTPPADARSKKGVSVVEDRVSVYTADPAVLQATQNARERRAAALIPSAAPPAPLRPGVTIGPVPSPSPGPSISTSTSDPCLNADPAFDCYGYYGGSPVFAGRRRAPRLNQPELPPGAIAGNVNAGGGFTPGLSTQGPLGSPAPRVERPRMQSAPARELERR